jgi:ABC-type phosphate transport system ATPase subunit
MGKIFIPECGLSLSSTTREWFSKSRILSQNQSMNVTYGPRMVGITKKRNELDDIVEESLKSQRMG